MDTRKQAGFNLLELIIVLALTVVITLIALPSYKLFLDKNNRTILGDTLNQHIGYARSMSILQGRAIEVCGSSDATHCDATWEKGWLIQSPSTREVFLSHTIESSDKLFWRGNRDSIRFQGNGTLIFGNGTFFLCSAKNTVLWKYVLSRQGRIREASNKEITELCM
ncbi:GspH/FimT family pseudopilin [Pseudomonas luteola]|uniref:GspH/FimT family pseudopilin n=1 Tax=Pseudomonas luteola TaxID=47886 RepID=UPI0039C1ADC7